MFSNEEGSEPLMSHTPNSKLDDAKSGLAGIEGFRSYYFDSLISRADALQKKAPALAKIFSEIFLFAGSGGVAKRTVGETTEQIRTIFHNEVEKAIEGAFGKKDNLTTQENDELRQAILGFLVANPEVQQAGQRISDLMKETRERAEKAGIPVGEVTDIGYLPRIYKTGEIGKNKQEFMDDAERLFREHEFELEVGDVNTTYTQRKLLAKYIGMMRHSSAKDKRVADAMKRVKAQLRIISNSSDQAVRANAFQQIINEMNSVRPIIQDLYAKERARAWAMGATSRTISDYLRIPVDPKAKPTKARELSGNADTVMKDWMETDIRYLMARYISAMSTKTAIAEAFGATPEETISNKLNNMKQDGKITEEQQDEALALVTSALGWKHRSDEKHPQTVKDWIHALGYVSLLEQAVATSLAEPITYTIRSGNLKHLALPLRQLARIFAENKVSDKEVAYAIGVIARNAISAVNLHRIGVLEADYSKIPSTMMTNFFRLNFLTQLTDDQRLLGVRVASEELKRWAKKAVNGSTKHTEFLNEHGIDSVQEFHDWISSIQDIPQVTDIFGADGAMTPMGQLYADAVHRFINGGIQNPNATTKPDWASDPRKRLLSGIFSFAYAIYENLIKREKRILERLPAGKGAERIATVFLPTITSLIVAQITISALRMVANGDDPDDEEFMDKAIKRGTLNAVSFGIAGQVLNFVTGYKYASNASESIIGAVPSYFAKAVDAMAGATSDRNSDNTETAENKAGKGVYDLFVAPLLAGGASLLPSSYKWFSRAVIAIESNKQTREKFAEMFGIPPERENATDKKYAEKMKGSEKAVELVTGKVKGKDKAQWDAQFESLKKEFPELLEGYEFVRYADNSANRKKGMAGDPQTTPSGKVKLQNKNLDEVEDEKKIVTSLNKSLKAVRTTSDMTYAGLKDAVIIGDKSYSPVADEILADISDEDMMDEVGRATRLKVIKDLEAQRTEVKKKAIQDLK